MSDFELKWKISPLQLRDVFTISRGSKSEVRNVFVSLTKNGITGFGEAGPNTRYAETAENVVQYLEKIPDSFFDEIRTADELYQKLNDLKIPPVQSAKAALEMAWLDWNAKSKQKALWKFWNETSPVGPVTSFTIGLDTPSTMQEKVRRASQYPVYKVKLGTDHDREIIAAIREVTDKPLRVDANEGWKTLDQAKEEISYLANNNVELVEQPMPASEIETMKELKAWSPLPLAADESFKGNENLEEVAEAFHIINIKLMKIGSLVKAREVIQQAKEIGLDVMIGCMIESSLAIAAGALLALQADYADLDGHLLITNDPFSGLELDDKAHLILSENSGFGVTPTGGW